MATWNKKEPCPNCGGTAGLKLKCENCGTLGCSKCVGSFSRSTCTICKKTSEKKKV